MKLEDILLVLALVVAKAIPPITIEQDIPAGDLEALNDNFGEISPAMIAAYRGAFEGAA